MSWQDKPPRTLWKHTDKTDDGANEQQSTIYTKTPTQGQINSEVLVQSMHTSTLLSWSRHILRLRSSMHKGSTNNEVDPAKSAPQYQAFSIVRLYSSVLGAALLNFGLRNQIRYKNPRARIYPVPNRHIGIGDNDLYHRFSIFNIRFRVHSVCDWLR